MPRTRVLAVGICLLGLLGLCFAIRADTGKKGPSASQEPLVDPECSVVDVVTLDNRTIDVQPGDVFYLTTSGPEGEKGVTVDLDNGEYGMVIRTGSRLPVRYNSPGTYMIHLDVTGEHLKPIKVQVLAPPKDLDKYNKPIKQSSSGIAVMAAAASSTPIGGSVGSVYAGVYPDTKSKFPIRICVSAPSGGDFTLTKYGGGWSQTWHFDGPGETSDVIDGPKPGENPWTLIKSGNSGTHVLSTNSPSKLKINRILMHSGPAYVAQPRADLTSSNIYLTTSTPLVLVVDPGPGWASNNTPRTDQLYEWKVDGISQCFAVSNLFSFPTPGTYQVSVECKSPTSPPQIKSLTINVLKVESIDGYVYGESGRKIANMEDLPDPANVVASGYMKFKATILPSSISDTLYYKWTATAGTLTSPEGTGNNFLEVKWDAPDGHEQAVTLTLEVKASASGPTICTETVDLKTIRPYVVRVKFVDDFWNEEQQIHDGGDPEFDAVVADNYPVCYVMHRGMQTQLDIAGEKDDDSVNNLTKKTPIKVSAKAAYGGIENQFDEDSMDDNTENWSALDYGTLEIESDDNVPEKVTEYEDFEMHWTFKVKNSSGSWIIAYEEETGYSQKTQHSRTEAGETYGLFLIYDVTCVPDSDFTMKHINYACETASDLNSPANIADAIGPDATGGARFDGDHTWHGSDAWNVIDLPSGADCGSLGWLMHNALELLGIGGSEARFVYACHADWSHLWDDEPAQNEPHPTLPGEYLGMWFGGADSWNNYEGCCYYDGKWWRGGYGDTRNSAANVLHSVCDPNIDGVANPHQAWTFAPSVHVDYP